MSAVTAGFADSHSLGFAIGSADGHVGVAGDLLLGKVQQGEAVRVTVQVGGGTAQVRLKGQGGVFGLRV